METSTQFWGISLVIICIWGAIPILLKQLVQKHTAYPVMLISALMFGCVGVLLTMFHARKQVSKVIKNFSKLEWLSLAFIVIAGSFFANMLYMWALERYNSAILVTVTSIFPLVTVLLGFWIFKEHLSLLTMLGILLIVTGVMCLSYSNRDYH